MAAKSKNARRKKPGKSVYLVPAVDKALEILAMLRAEGREMNLADISKATGSHKSSVQRLMTTLCHHGFVKRDEVTKRYALGIALAEYGRVALNNLDIRQLAKPYLQALVDYSGETAVLAIMNDTKMVMIDKREPPSQIRASPFIGLRFPATATSNGKALLAWLPEERVNEIMRIEGLPAPTKNSIIKPSVYKADLAAARERGYAIDREEFQEGVSGVSAPVFSPKGQVIATISLAAPAFRMTEESVRKYGEKCVEVAAQLSAQLL
ncbi:MAG: IclR family transcriptional regulator [Acidobacteria bacterium]|nr:IclR family transcriptional regulator [Acidobacteriota bacterium]